MMHIDTTTEAFADIACELRQRVGGPPVRSRIVTLQRVRR
jgi:hypothetical protein